MIYVYYPRGAETGGPEALHQLVDSIRRQGKEAFLTPMLGFENNSRVGLYEKYDAPEGYPTNGDAVVVPEICPGLLNRYPASKKYIWWLAAGVPTQDNAIHLAQSKFAESEILKAGFAPKMLSDYTPEHTTKTNSNRGLVISYNGNKGAEFVEAVRSLLPDVIWTPIHGMSRAQVKTTLNNSAIYLDLGHHPGKDRMPREAALAGSVVITSKRGSAALEYSDIPILEKVDHDDSQAISSLISDVLLDLDGYFRKQDSYRRKILDEKTVFDGEVKDIFL